MVHSSRCLQDISTSPGAVAAAAATDSAVISSFMNASSSLSSSSAVFGFGGCSLFDARAFAAPGLGRCLVRTGPTPACLQKTIQCEGEVYEEGVGTYEGAGF